MTHIVALITAAGLALAGVCQAVQEPAKPCLRIHTSFDLVVHAPYAATAPLFGPNGERAWAGEHWNPVFIYPLPAHDVEGAVFTVSHGPLSAVWVNTLFDIDGRHFQYVYFLPGLMVTVIDVRFRPVDPETTMVDVDYTRTALTPEGNDHVTGMSEGDKKAGAEWQQAIDAYLEHSKAAKQP